MNRVKKGTVKKVNIAMWFEKGNVFKTNVK